MQQNSFEWLPQIIGQSSRKELEGRHVFFPTAAFPTVTFQTQFSRLNYFPDFKFPDHRIKFPDFIFVCYTKESKGDQNCDACLSSRILNIFHFWPCHR